MNEKTKKELEEMGRKELEQMEKEKMEKCENALIQILNDEKASISYKANALNRYNQEKCSHKFAIRIEHLIRKTESRSILDAAVKLANRMNIRNSQNPNLKLRYKMNKNVSKKIEKYPPFNNPTKVLNMIKQCLSEMELPKDISLWDKEDIGHLKGKLFELYPKEAELIHDRFPNKQKFYAWIKQYYKKLD